MIQHPFSIEFYFRDDAGETGLYAGPKYQAVITTLSKTLKLFKVSCIRRITGDSSIELSECYHLTPYPLTIEKDDCWKDALTLSSNEFLQAIGREIDRHIYHQE